MPIADTILCYSLFAVRVHSAYTSASALDPPELPSELFVRTGIFPAFQSTSEEANPNSSQHPAAPPSASA
ncbi:hypothetical protein NM688_g6299 [Phlebia brevispora]|uniref:Uncharacterized protein n=1 Tax=Phlebia brevispora TaxID=194682 RepID=A0ACC1SHN1_9APHY|nr:hypothetical protein NM688_g6299 [Phlebia brevispora]